MKKMLRTLCLMVALLMVAALVPALAEEAAPATAQIVIGETVYTIDPAKTSVIAPAAEGYGDGEDDGSTYVASGAAKNNEDGSVTLSRAGWRAFVPYGGAVGTAVTADGGQLYLHYDFTIEKYNEEAAGSAMINLAGWNLAMAPFIAQQAGVELVGDERNQLPAGEYKGMIAMADVLSALADKDVAAALEMDETLDAEEEKAYALSVYTAQLDAGYGIIGVAGANVTIRALEYVCVIVE